MFLLAMGLLYKSSFIKSYKEMDNGNLQGYLTLGDLTKMTEYGI